jgi:acyl-CoA reductase-like NAD-dependent aldehyde dehydrogenase
MDDETSRVLTEIELRHQQRYEAQQSALAAALVSQEKAVNAALAAADRAVTKSETAAESRFASVNEFRQTLSDQATRFQTRAESEAALKPLSDRLDVNVQAIERLREHQSNTQGRSSAFSSTWSSGLAVLAILISLAGVVYSVSSTPTDALLRQLKVDSQTGHTP